MTDLLTHPIDLLRIGNALACLFAAVAFAIRINDDWHTMTARWRAVVVGLWCFPAAAAYGSIESLYQDAPIGLRTGLVTVSALVVLVGLLLVRSERMPIGARRVPASKVLDVVDAVEHPRDGEPPCTHPGCLRARAELLELAHADHPYDH